MEKKNKTKSALKCSSNLIPRKTKSRLSLQKFLDSLKRQESDFINESKQITQCVFLGALRLKPVPDIFQVTLQPITFSTHPKPRALTSNNGKTVNVINKKDKRITYLKTNSNNVRKQSRVNNTTCKNPTNLLPEDQKAKNRILELFNNHNITRRDSPDETTAKKSLKLKDNPKVHSKHQYKVKVGEIVGKNRKIQEKEVYKAIRSHSIKKEDPLPRLSLKSQTKGVKKVDNSKFLVINNNLRSDNKLNSAVTNIKNKNKRSDLDEALAQLKKNKGIQIKEDMELKTEPNFSILSGKHMKNYQYDTLRGLSVSPVIIDLEDSIINNNFVSKQDDTIDFVDIDDDEIEDYLEIDQNVVADLEALIPQDDIEYISNTLISQVNPSSEFLTDNLPIIPEKETDHPSIPSKPIEKLISHCDNDGIEVPIASKHAKKSKLKKSIHQKNSHKGMSISENNNQLGLMSDKGIDFDLSNTEYEIISLIDESNESSIPKIILKDRKKKRSTLLPGLKKADNSLKDTKSSVTRILRRNVDELKQEEIEPKFVETSTKLPITDVETNPVLIPESSEAKLSENVYKIKRISPDTKRVEFINPLKLNSHSIPDNVQNGALKATNSKKSPEDLCSQDVTRSKQILEMHPDSESRGCSETVPRKVTRASVLKSGLNNKQGKELGDLREEIIKYDNVNTPKGNTINKLEDETIKPHSTSDILEHKDISADSKNENQIVQIDEAKQETIELKKIEKPVEIVQEPQIKDEEMKILVKNEISSEDVSVKKPRRKRKLQTEEKEKLNSIEKIPRTTIFPDNENKDDPKLSSRLEENSAINSNRSRLKISPNEDENGKGSVLKTSIRRTRRKKKTICNSSGIAVDLKGLEEIKAEPVPIVPEKKGIIIREINELRGIPHLDSKIMNNIENEGLKRKSTDKSEETIKKQKVMKKGANIQTSILRYLKPIPIKTVSNNLSETQDNSGTKLLKDEYNFEDEDENCDIMKMRKKTPRNSQDLQEQINAEPCVDSTVPIIEEKPKVGVVSSKKGSKEKGQKNIVTSDLSVIVIEEKPDLKVFSPVLKGKTVKKSRGKFQEKQTEKISSDLIIIEEKPEIQTISTDLKKTTKKSRGKSQDKQTEKISSDLIIIEAKPDIQAISTEVKKTTKKSRGKSQEKQTEKVSLDLIIIEEKPEIQAIFTDVKKTAKKSRGKSQQNLVEKTSADLIIIEENPDVEAVPPALKKKKTQKSRGTSQEKLSEKSSPDLVVIEEQPKVEASSLVLKEKKKKLRGNLHGKETEEESSGSIVTEETPKLEDVTPIKKEKMAKQSRGKLQAKETEKNISDLIIIEEKNETETILTGFKEKTTKKSRGKLQREEDEQNISESIIIEEKPELEEISLVKKEKKIKRSRGKVKGKETEKKSSDLIIIEEKPQTEAILPALKEKATKKSRGKSQEKQTGTSSDLMVTEKSLEVEDVSKKNTVKKRRKIKTKTTVTDSLVDEEKPLVEAVPPVVEEKPRKESPEKLLEKENEERLDVPVPMIEEKPRVQAVAVLVKENLTEVSPEKENHASALDISSSVIEGKPEVEAVLPILKEKPVKKPREKKNKTKKEKSTCGENKNVKVVKEEVATLNNNDESNSQTSSSSEIAKSSGKKKKKKDPKEKKPEETLSVIEKIVKGGGDYSEDSKETIPDAMREDLLNPNSALSQEIERRMQMDFYNEFPNYGPQEPEPYKRVYKCRVCLVVLKTYNKLKAHKKIHNVKNPYRCQECGNSYNDVEELAAHLRIHQGKMPYPCKKCDSSFWTSGQLERHQIVHILKKVPPPVKAPKKIYKCEECGKEFKKICDLERHTRVHTGEKPSVCNICNKRFQQAYNLNKHLLIHTQEKNFECVICQKRFGRNDVLNRHVLTHSIDKPFHCSICSKTFIRNTQLNLHLRKHHELEEEPKTPYKKKSLIPAATKSSD